MKTYFGLKSANERLRYILEHIIDKPELGADDLGLIRRIENALEEARLDGMEDGLSRQVWFKSAEELAVVRKVLNRHARKKP